ncbi:MAG: cupin domain-containing protein [Butyricicoccaceae bacterium]
MIRRANEQRVEKKEHLRGGEGYVTLQHLLEPGESCGKCKMIARITIEPGNTIGDHAHNPDAELCYLLEGELTITDGGEEHVMYPGDAWICGEGNRHCTMNKSEAPAVFLGIVIE